MSVETIIILGIASVFCILLTNRFNLIGPVVLIAVGVGAASETVAPPEAKRTCGKPLIQHEDPSFVKVTST